MHGLPQAIVMFYVHSIVSPNQPCRKIMYIMAKINIKAWLNAAGKVGAHSFGINISYNCELFRASQKDLLHFKEFLGFLRLEQAPCTMSGALRDDSTGAHAFLFLRRRGH